MSGVSTYTPAEALLPGGPDLLERLAGAVDAAVHVVHEMMGLVAVVGGAQGEDHLALFARGNGDVRLNRRAGIESGTDTVR